MEQMTLEAGTRSWSKAELHLLVVMEKRQGLEIEAIPGLPTPMVSGTAQKYTRQRCSSEISELCCLSAPHAAF